MKITPEQKESLLARLNEEIGRERNAFDGSPDFYSVYQLVGSLIPYEIREPEDNLRMEGVFKTVKDPSPEFMKNVYIDFDHSKIDKIPSEQLKSLHDGIEAIQALTRPECHLGSRSEIKFDRLIKNSRDALLKVMGALDRSLKIETQNLSSQSLDEMAEKMMKLYAKAGMPQAHSERTQENEISAHQRIHNMVLDNIQDSISACRKMLGIHDTVLDLLKQNRAAYIG